MHFENTICSVFYERSNKTAFFSIKEHLKLQKINYFGHAVWVGHDKSK